MTDKALVIKTGEILDIKSFYKIMNITIQLPFGVDKSIVSEWEQQLYIPSDKKDKPKEGDYYILSDGNKYNGDELIVGLDNIRDYKINSINV